MVAVGAVKRFDAFQQRHAWAGVPLAVVYKFVEDQGGYLAALIAYYGFLSLFPLLLLLVSVLGFVLHNDPHLQQQVVDSALQQFPVIGDQIGENITSFHGNPFAVAAGAAGGLYGALGVAQAAQNALSKIWAVPRHARPDPLRARLRSLLVLGGFGAGLLATTCLTVLASDEHFLGAHLGVAVRAAASLTAVAVNAGLLLFAYRFFTHSGVALRHLAGAAAGAAVLWQALQWAGTYYVRHQLRGATATYGLFGIVLGLITWIYLGALIFVLAAETTSVRVRRLWPRSLPTLFTDKVVLNQADLRAYTSYATTETFKGFEQIAVSFDPPPLRTRDGTANAATEPAPPASGPPPSSTPPPTAAPD
ncbi:YihY/virulence factor BrkB family protein [Actinacidiphila sp. ITFR-21]|uniref:YihY/virulence factor BrkB family protein n=1 Tax=Actinacidiphila sp. ITFR-21 TaxID=3075199 RepID=UPI00288B3F90|nr:YihY/virulence factor BrkB family protein [Streptomyces sp. ITFR-21]WNI14118.1 YihY/virulence factor BrkB family protein [Streptomyces sp. ITFR-21]